MSLNLDMSYTQLPDQLYAASTPVQFPQPSMLITNDAFAEELGLTPKILSDTKTLDVFSGRVGVEGHTPIAMAYSGHQFGHFSPRLGDGRAVLLGGIVSPQKLRYDIHLKGSGQTPFSRRGDGKSTLRAALKEYIFSESFAALEIPTTRSLAVLTTGETVHRNEAHPGAILVRAARSHIRVGTFQFTRLLDNIETLRALADFAIAREYPEIAIGEPERYVLFLEKVILRQAALIAHWMSAGFVHGVMNTDNMAISGETIDFGPCAFVDGFRFDRVFSSIDQNGRYAWNKQAEIALWNLTRLAEALLPLLDSDEDEAVKKAEGTLNAFMPEYVGKFHERMSAKLGIVIPTGNPGENLISRTFSLLHEHGVDYTLFFSALSRLANGSDRSEILNLFENSVAIETWLAAWSEERAKSPKAVDSLTAQMAFNNPLYIPRTYQVEAALEKASAGEMELFNRLLKAVQNPFVENPEFALFAKPPNPEESQIVTFCET